MSDTGTSHFHVYMHGEDSFDLGRFDTFEEAIDRAMELTQLGKIIRIEQFSAKCPRCATKIMAASAN